MNSSLEMHNRGADRRRVFASAPSTGAKPVVERRRHDERRLHGFISRLQLFSSIAYDAVEAVLADCEVRDIAAGAVLLVPGQSNDAIHLLISGRIHIHLDYADSTDYMVIEEGGCFGELSIIDGRPASAYVVAAMPSRILVIHDNVLWERLVAHPGVARNLLKQLSQRMRANGEIILARMKDRLALEVLQKELSDAQKIQLSMLPSGSRLFPGHADVAAYATIEPAKDVGGDLYDAFFAGPTRVFVAVGDVSGKGMPAALFMARAITHLRMEAVRSRTPSEVLEAVNRALCEGNDAGMFVTLFCGFLDTVNGEFAYANAGHNPPVLLGSGGKRKFLKLTKGLVAGIMDGTRYPTDTLTLAPGNSLLMYTDGVTEAMNPGSEFYAEQRLLDAACEHAASDPRALVDALRADLAHFVQDAPQADDITLLALRYRGAAA